MPFCSNCGKEITADANFCYHCGSRVAKPSTVSELETSVSDAQDIAVGAKLDLDVENVEESVQKKRRAGSRVSRNRHEKSDIVDLSSIFDDDNDNDLNIPGEDEDDSQDSYFINELKIAENLLLECSLDEAYAKFKTLAEEGCARAYIFLGIYDYYKLNRKETDVEHVKECFAKGSELGDKLGEFATLFFTDLTEEQRKSALEYSKEIDKDDFVANFILGRVVLGEERDKYTGDAVELLRTSERRGFQLAMYELGQYFFIMANDGASAANYFAEADDKGYTPASLRLAELYQSGEGVEPNANLAFILYLKVAKRGFSEAQNRVGMFYSNGLGTETDLDAAREWFTKSAEQDFPYGQFNLARLLEKDEAPNSATDAFYWCKKAADNGLADAMCKLGSYYEKGFGTAVDEAMAFKYFSLAQENGDNGALYKLALAYEKGIGIDKDSETAFAWMQEAAESGNDEAICHLGKYYESGYGCQKNLTIAFEQYLEAANRGYDEAQYRVALAYEKGVGTYKNLLEAFKYCQMAADQSHVAAMCLLAEYYENGIGTSENLRMAEGYYKRAAETNNPDAQYRYGQFLDFIADDDDEDSSFRWYNLASLQGHAAATREVAGYYMNGSFSVYKDVNKAIELYKEAAENGDAEAKNELGMLYFKGEYLDKDVQTAIDYFTDAAEGGSNKAMYNMAYCYMNGFGVAKNLDRAYEFAKKAVEHHHPNAKNLLDKIEEMQITASRPPMSKNEKLYRIMLKYKGSLKYRAMYFRAGEPTPEREQEADRVLKQCYAEFGQEKFARSYKDGQPGVLMIASNDARTVREPYYQDKLLITSRALVTSYNGYFIPLPLITRVAYKNNCLYVGFKKDGQVQTLPIIGLFIGNDGTMLENLINEMVAVINS